MSTKFELSLADYLEAQKLHAKWTDNAVRVRNAIWAIMSVVLMLGLYAHQYLVAGALLGGIAGSFLVPFIWNRFVGPVLARNRFKGLKESHKHKTLDIDESGLWIGDPPGLLKWSEFVKWKESGECILAYIDKNIFFVIPKRVASDTFNVHRLREMLKNEVGSAN